MNHVQLYSKIQIFQGLAKVFLFLGDCTYHDSFRSLLAGKKLFQNLSKNALPVWGNYFV